MHKTILMMLLAVMSSSAAAEWMKVSESSRFNGYFDFETKRQLGNMVKMWVLQDYKTVQVMTGDSVLSVKITAVRLKVE